LANLSQAGTTREGDSYKADAHLSPQGVEYATKMGKTLLEHREKEREAFIKEGGADTPLKPLTVWTSTRRRTVETADWLTLQGYKVRQRSQMSQLNPGVCEKMSERRIRQEYPDEVAKHEADPYHHRYPRAEVRTEPFVVHSNYLLISAVISRCGSPPRANHPRARA
jgi:6-phosphofructo-2-kinase / fructose-2,6-biphosphatase 4